MDERRAVSGDRMKPVVERGELGCSGRERLAGGVAAQGLVHGLAVDSFEHQPVWKDLKHLWANDATRVRNAHELRLDVGSAVPLVAAQDPTLAVVEDPTGTPLPQESHPTMIGSAAGSAIRRDARGVE